jgi:predicted DNA-binding protein with PD1-like motif
MRAKLLHDGNGERTFALVFDPGENPVTALPEFARTEKIAAARVSGIGGFSRVILGYFDMARKEYLPVPVEEQVEVVAFLGNLSLFEGKPRLHAHVTIGRRDGAAMAGHLLEARVQPTLELMLVALPATLERGRDKGTGLPLLKP